MPYHPKSVPEYPLALSAEAVQTVFRGCGDFFLRRIRLGAQGRVAAAVCWLDGVVSADDLSQDVLRALAEHPALRRARDARQAAEAIAEGAVWRAVIGKRRTADEVAADLAAGFCAVLFDELGLALTFEVKSAPGRAVSEASVEKAVKGPRDAFVETLRVNTALVRRRLRTPKLKLVEQTVGRESATPVSLLYIEGIARPETVAAVRRQLAQIDTDALLGAGDLEPYVAGRPRCPLPRAGHTERPDKFAAALLQGRVGLLADGLPTGFLLPGTLPMLMRVPEDRADTPLMATCLTVLRWAALLIAAVLPALYTAAAVYHQEMLPAQLLVSMVEAEQDVPFGAAAIMAFLLIAFELLQEAGLRLPAPVGQTVSIIGALLVGEAAVSARVASPIAIIVVALAGIAGYNVPNQELASLLRAARLALLLAAAAGGLFLLTAACAALVWYACTVECFGLSWLSPITDSEDGALRRVFLRRAQTEDKYRERETVWRNRRKQK